MKHPAVPYLRAAVGVRARLAIDHPPPEQAAGAQRKRGHRRAADGVHRDEHPPAANRGRGGDPRVALLLLLDQVALPAQLAGPRGQGDHGAAPHPDHEPVAGDHRGAGDVAVGGAVAPDRAELPAPARRRGRSHRRRASCAGRGHTTATPRRRAARPAPAAPASRDPENPSPRRRHPGRGRRRGASATGVDDELADHPRVQRAVKAVVAGRQLVDSVDERRLAAADQRAREEAFVGVEIVVGDVVEVGESKRVALPGDDRRRGVGERGGARLLLGGRRRRRAREPGSRAARCPAQGPEGRCRCRAQSPRRRLSGPTAGRASPGGGCRRTRRSAGRADPVEALDRRRLAEADQRRAEQRPAVGPLLDRR